MLERLKNDWHTWRFEQMAMIVNDRIDNPAEADVEHYVGLEHIDSDSLIIRRWGLPSDVEATKLRFCSGDIIFGRRRVYQRKLAVARFDGICSAHAMVLRARPEVALPNFLPFFMQSDLFMERAKQISVGSLSPTINWRTLAQEEFSLPPVEEQRKIAEVLGAYEVLSEVLNDISIHASTVIHSLAQSSLVQLEQAGIPMKPLADIGTVLTGRTPSSAEPGCWGDDIPFATPGDMGMIEPNLRICERSLSHHGTSQSVVVPAGSVLVVCIGSTIGKVAKCEVPMAFNQQINAIVPREVDSTYLFMCLLECGHQLSAQKATTAVPIVNKNAFSHICIPVPSRAKQQEIAGHVSSLLGARDACALRLRNARKGKTVLLQKVLRAET